MGVRVKKKKKRNRRLINQQQASKIKQLPCGGGELNLLIYFFQRNIIKFRVER